MRQRHVNQTLSAWAAVGAHSIAFAGFSGSSYSPTKTATHGEETSQNQRRRGLIGSQSTPRGGCQRRYLHADPHKLPYLPLVSASITPALARYCLNSSFFASGACEAVIDPLVDRFARLAGACASTATGLRLPRAGQALRQPFFRTEPTTGRRAAALE